MASSTFHEENVGQADMEALEEEFAKHLVIEREKAAVAKEPTKATGPLARLMELKKRAMDKIEKHRAFIENLMPPELDKVKKFMDMVKSEKNRQPPPPLKRPDGLELSLLGVALFSGNESVSKFIRYITKSKYSHVALLLHDVTKQPSDPEGWYVYSANGSASQIMADRRMPQVQLEKWTETIEGYDGAVVSRLIVFETESPSSSVITELIDRYIGLPYEKQLLIMLKAMNRTNVEATDSANSAFCSEICYRILAAANVIHDTEVPENIWPKHFSDESEQLKLYAAAWGEHVFHKALQPSKPTATFYTVTDVEVNEIQMLTQSF